MQIRVIGLTAAQSKVMEAMQLRMPELVSTVNRTSVVFNDAPKACRDRVQEVMDGVRETEGAGSRIFASLRSVRDKLDDATKAPGGSTSYVSVLSNGTDVEGEIPAVLAGLRVDEPGENVTAPVPAPRDRARTDHEVTPSRGTLRPVERDEVLERMRPTLPQPEITPAALDNFKYMLRTAPTYSAAGFWEEKIDKLTADKLTQRA